MSAKETPRRRRERVYDGWARPYMGDPPEWLGRPTRAEDVRKMVEQLKRRWRREREMM